MSEIREYSSIYATKLAYALSNDIKSTSTGVISYISNRTKEKDTTAKNWLFGGRVPREPKRLSISDAIGTSENYLFNDDVPVTEITKPEIVKNEGCYLVPLLEERQIFDMKKADQFPIAIRIPIMFPQLDKMIERYGKKVYATKISSSSFQPHIDNNALLLYTESVILEEYKFVLIHLDNGGLKLKRIISVDGDFKLLHYGSRNEEIVESITSEEDLLLVLLAFSL